MTHKPQQSDLPEFVGRESLVERLVSALRANHRAVLRSELPGLGASRIALEVYQALHSEDAALLVTLDAQDELTWCHSLLEIASAKNLRESHLRKSHDLLSGVRAWLRQQNVMLVIDHVNDFERVSPLLDGLRTAQVLLIGESRNSIPGDWAKSEQLEPLSQEETVFWLMNSLQLHAVERSEQKKLEQLAATLKGIPQVINTIGTLLAHGMTLDSCLNQQLSLTKRIKLQDPVALAFQHACSHSKQDVSIELAQLAVANGTTENILTDQTRSGLLRLGLLQACPLSNKLFLPRCYLKYAEQGASLTELINQQKPELMNNRFYASGLAGRILSSGDFVVETTDLIESAAESSLASGAWHRAAELYTRLLTRLRNHHTVDGVALAHVLVRLARCEQAGQRFAHAHRHLNEALDHVRHSLPEASELLMDLAEHDINEAQVPRALRRIQLVAAIHNKLNYVGENLARARRLFLRGACSLAQQDGESAVRVLERSHTIQNSLLPLDHADVLKTRTLLTRALFATKKLDRAEAILREDLQIRDQSNQVSSSEILVTLNSLAELLFHRGKLDESEQLFERVLTMRESVLEENHQSIAETACHIAKLKSTRGAFQEADKFFRKSMSIMLERYGESHPEVARVNNDLAESLFTQGKYDQAQRILTRSLRLQEAALRPTDPALGRTRNNLAAIQVALGSYENAEKLYQRDLEAKRSAQPISPLSLAMTVNNLGEVVRSQGRLDESIVFFQEALELRERHLKPDHPLVAQSLVNLGYVYLLRCKTESAEEYFQRAIAIRKQALSTEHPHLASLLSCLAQIRIIDEQYDAANTFLEEAEEICLKVYGDEHPQYANLLSKTGRVQLRLSRKARAELKLLKSKTILEKIVGSNHRFYAEALQGMGELRQREGKLQEAFPMMERALAIFQETTHGPRFEIGELQFQLGYNLRQRGETKAAGERFTHCLEIWKQLLGEESSRVIECEMELGQILVSLHQYSEAEQLLMHVSSSSHSEGWELDRKVALVGALADALAGLKKYSEAEAMLNKQLELLGNDESDRKNRLSVYSHLAGVKYLMQDLDGAEPWVLKCVELASSIHGADHPESAKHRENLAGLYFTRGRTQEAEQLINQAIEIFEIHYGVEHPAYQTAMSNYSRLLRTQNRETDAQAIDNQLDEIQSRNSHVLDF